jgi:hypothetical protein
MAIILVVIGAYYWLLVTIIVVAIGAYYIIGYW